MMHITAVSKNFEDLEALNTVNMHIKPGSIYGLVGTNGAGKTTLLKIASGIYRPNQGTINFQKEPVYENPKAKSQMQFMADQLYFYPQQTLKEAGQWYKGLYPQWNQERFETLVKGFNLNNKKPIDRFSKGVQRQAAFCLSLSTMPRLMLLDEPLDGLDPVMRQKVKNLLVQDVAERKMSVLISSHNLRELEDLCDTIGILHQGNLIIEKELDQLRSGVIKVQLAFSGEVPPIPEPLEILHCEGRGSVMMLIVKGNEDQIIKHLKTLNPVILDTLPLTLDEIFIYEMGDRGYEINDILL